VVPQELRADMSIANLSVSLLAASETLYSLARAQGYCDILLDPMAALDVVDKLAIDATLAPRHWLKDVLFQDSPKLAPCLVRIPNTHWDTVDALLQQAQKEATDPECSVRSVCAFLISSADSKALSNTLSRALDIRVQASKIYLRYFDPRTMHHLGHLLSVSELGNLLGGVTKWCYFAWDGQLSVHTIQTPEYVALSPLRLTLQRWQAFEAIEHFNAVQQTFAHSELPFAPKDTQIWFKRVQDAIAMGISKPTDTAHYLACTPAQGQPINQHPRWSEVLELLRSDVPLATALEQLCNITPAQARG
jgi:Domain of unknown function (DUF4123)